MLTNTVSGVSNNSKTTADSSVTTTTSPPTASDDHTTASSFNYVRSSHLPDEQQQQQQPSMMCVGYRPSPSSATMQPRRYSTVSSGYYADDSISIEDFYNQNYNNYNYNNNNKYVQSFYGIDSEGSQICYLPPPQFNHPHMDSRGPEAVPFVNDSAQTPQHQHRLFKDQTSSPSLVSTPVLATDNRRSRPTFTKKLPPKQNIVSTSPTSSTGVSNQLFNNKATMTPNSSFSASDCNSNSSAKKSEQADTVNFKDMENIVNKILVPMKSGFPNDILGLEEQFYKLDLENISDSYYQQQFNTTDAFGGSGVCDLASLPTPVTTTFNVLPTKVPSGGTHSPAKTPVPSSQNDVPVVTNSNTRNIEITTTLPFPPSSVDRMKFAPQTGSPMVHRAYVPTSPVMAPHHNSFMQPAVVPPNMYVASQVMTQQPPSVSMPTSTSERKAPAIQPLVTGILDKTNKLEAFRNNTTAFANMTLKDIQGWIVEFSRDQHGSRFIQQKMEKSTNGVDRDIVFKEIIATDTILYTLMTDVFGNYVVQKMLEFGNEHHKRAIALHLKSRVLTLTTQMYGCRVIQKAIECIPRDLQSDLIHELDGHVLECVKDQNGNHVIQKCIEHVPAENLDFIINEFNGCVSELSSHPYGCRVIQRLMEHCAANQTQGLMVEIFAHAPSLVKDQYGNYVIQHILDHKKHQNFPMRIINYVFDNIFALSAHKFASNVVEKCIQFSSLEQKEALVKFILKNSDGGPNDNLYLMMKDPFANYVVQKIVDSVNGDMRKQLLLKMKPYFTSLKKLTYGKHMINKVDRWLKETETMNSFIKCEDEFPSLDSAEHPQ